MENIVFDSIKIENFLSIGSAEVNLSEQGFILVKGRNEEGKTVQSNGSGKSTIFDAIFWSLTGETLRGASDVVNETNKSEGCYCSLSFHSLDSTYKIIRSKSHKEYGSTCQFFVNDELVSDQTKKSQEMIIKTIPSVASSEILGSIILLGQGLPYKFSSFSPIKRKDLLETMSGSSSEINKVSYKLDIECEEHSSRITELKTDVGRNEGMIRGYNSLIDTTNRKIRSIKTKEQIDAELKKFEDKIVNARRSIDISQESIGRLNCEKDSATQKLQELNEVYQNYTFSLQTIETQINSFKQGTCPTCGRPYETTNEQLQQLEILKNKLPSISNKANEISESIGRGRSYIQERETQIRTENSSIYSNKLVISDAESHLRELQNQLDDVDSLKKEIEETQSKIDACHIKNNENEKEVFAEDEYIDCIKYLKRQLSRDFKGYMLEEVIKFMSSRSEYYSNYLFTNDKKIEISLSGNKILITVGGRLYENLSGGERQRVDLAVQFALRDMLVTTSGFSCNLLVLDEAFDNLDAQGSDALIQLVTTEFSDIDSVFVVTHHSEIDIPYDKEITVVKNSYGVSSLEMSY